MGESRQSLFFTAEECTFHVHWRPNRVAAYRELWQERTLMHVWNFDPPIRRKRSAGIKSLICTRKKKKADEVWNAAMSQKKIKREDAMKSLMLRYKGLIACCHSQSDATTTPERRTDEGIRAVRNTISPGQARMGAFVACHPSSPSPGNNFNFITFYTWSLWLQRENTKFER